MSVISEEVDVSDEEDNYQSYGNCYRIPIHFALDYKIKFKRILSQRVRL